MNHKYVNDSRPRRINRGLSAAPVDWAGVISGTVQPTVNFNVQFDDDTTKTIYVATGTLSGAILLAAIINLFD